MGEHSLIVAGCLLLGSFTETNSGNETIAMPRRCVGKLIVWSVRASLTESRVRSVFGDPEMTMSETHDPIGTYYTTTTLGYLRFGVFIDFRTNSPPVDDGRKNAPARRVHGGIG